MKKKTVIAVLSALAAATTFGAACNKQHECEHESWQTKAQGGFHYLECEKCGEKKDYDLHVDEKNNETQESGADGKCDVCGADVTNVTYEWKSNDETHWVEIEGNKLGLGGHVDATGDGRCDTCGKLSKLTVTFNNGGKCENVVSSVEYGSAAAKPADPKASGWVFLGWYADEAGETEYNFANVVTEATTVYAKWEADKTPGLNPAYAIAVELDTEKPAQFGAADKLYFKYTAASAGRYEVYLTGATADECTFATDVDDAKYTVIGKDATYFDLAKGETVVLEVTRGAEVSNEDMLMVYFSSNVNEPLPASWVSGSYENDEADIALLIDNEKKIATLNETDAPIFFVGGANAQASFTVNNVRYTLTPKADGVLAIKGGRYNCDLTLFVQPEPIAVSEFSGIYKPENKDVLPQLNEICIYPNGDGYLVLNGTKQSCTLGVNSSYDQSRNTLTYYNSYIIKLVLTGEGEPAVISVKTDGKTARFSYVSESGDPIPAKLPLTEGETYYGYAGNVIKVDWNGAKINNVDYYLVINSYNAQENRYELSANNKRYTLIIEGEGDDAVIKWIGEGDAVIDTFEIVSVTYHELSITADEQTITLSTENFLRGVCYYYEIAKSGYYKFSAETENFEIRKQGTNLVNPTGVLISLDPEKDAEYLSAGDKIVISIANEETKPESVTFKLSEGLPPKGTAASNPFKVETTNGIGSYRLANVANGKFNYLEFTNLTAGTYYICVSSENAYQYLFTLNGVEYGCTYEGWYYYWNDGKNKTNYTTLSSDARNFYIPVTIAEDEDKLAVSVTKPSFGSDEDVLVRLWADPLADAETLTFDGEGKGAITADGNFKLESLAQFKRAVAVTFKSESEFTAYLDGNPVSGTEVTIMSDQLKLGFTIIVPENATVNYEPAYESGAQQNPYKLDTLGENSIKQVAGQLTYVEIDLTKYTLNKDFTISLGATLYYFQINGGGTKYGYGITDGAMGALENEVLKYTVTDDASKKFLIVVGSDSPTASDNGLKLKITVNVEENANVLSFTNIPIGDSIISFAPANVTASNGNWVIKKYASTTMILTGPSKFTLLFADGSTKEAKLSNGNYVIEDLQVKDTNDLYFKISSEEEQLIVVATSYAHGSQGYPLEAEFKNGVYEITASTTTYVYVEAGTYRFYGNYLYVDSTGYNNGRVVTFEEKTLVSFYSSGSLTMLVPELLRRDYAYTDGGEQQIFTLGERTFTVGNTEYTLTATNGDEYTFTAMSGDTTLTVKLNLGADMKFNDFDMEIYVPEIFTAEEAGTYTGAGLFNNTISITFNLAGEGEMYLLNSNLGTTRYEFKKMKVNGDGTYTITPTNGGFTVTMTFTDSGVNLTYNAPGVGNQSSNLSRSYALTEEQAGNYVGNAFGKNVSLKITRDGAGELVMLNGNLQTDTITFSSIKVNADGTFTISVDKGDYTFKYEGEEVVFTSVPGVGFQIRMQKTHMFTEDQAGTYKGSFLGDIIELTFDIDGKGTMTMPLGNMGEPNKTETFDKIVDNGDGTYSINGKVTFKFTSNGIQVTKLPMGVAAANLTKPTVQGPSIVPGTYVGGDFKLVISDDNTLVYFYDFGDVLEMYSGEFTAKNGKFTFTYFDEGAPTDCTFTFNEDGTISFADGWYTNGNNVTLTLQAD